MNTSRVVSRETFSQVSRETTLDIFGAGAPVVGQRLFTAMVQISIQTNRAKRPSLRGVLARPRQ